MLALRICCYNNELSPSSHYFSAWKCVDIDTITNSKRKATVVTTIIDRDKHFGASNKKYKNMQNNTQIAKQNGHQSLKRDKMTVQLHEAKHGWKMLADFEFSFPKFGEWYGPVNIIFKCWYVFKLYLNWRFYVNSNNFGILNAIDLRLKQGKSVAKAKRNTAWKWKLNLLTSNEAFQNLENATAQ